MTATPTAPGQPAAPGRPHKTAPPPAGRVPWRAAGIGLTSLATPIGIGAAAPLPALALAAAELAVALAVIATALFGTPELSERAFRLLRWTANRPEPPAPARL